MEELSISDVGSGSQCCDGMCHGCQCGTEKDATRFWIFINGPYNQHNTFVHQARTLLNNNQGLQDSRLYQIFPIGGRGPRTSHIIVTLVWYIQSVYPLIAFWDPGGSSNYNVITAAVLTFLFVLQISLAWVVTKNWKKLKRLQCTCQVPLDNYFGCRCKLMRVSQENVRQLDVINQTQRQYILNTLDQAKGTRECICIMLTTRSYWRSKVLDPILCLGIMSALCAAAVVVQLHYLLNKLT